MKQLFAILVIAVMLVSCDKGNSDKRMTVEQLKIETGIDLIAAWDIQFGATARTMPNGKGKKPEKNDLVTLIDGVITDFDGTTFTTSDNPKFAGVNNQTSLISICNWFFYEGGTAQVLMCSNSTGSGDIMAWNTDWSDNVYRSELITIP